jgi:hypothetical protein
MEISHIKSFYFYMQVWLKMLYNIDEEFLVHVLETE